MGISVIIPAYNAEAFIVDAVRSALLPNVCEVLVVDDGSTDGTAAVCARMASEDLRVKLLRHKDDANRGVSASRNLGIREASGTYIAFLDADDRFLPERFREEARIFTEHPDADGVYGAIGVHVLDAEGHERYERVFRQELTTLHHRLPPERLFPVLVGLEQVEDLGHFHLDGLTVRRACLQQMDPCFNEALHMHEDTEFIVRLAYHYRLYAGDLDRAVATRGVHAGNRFTRHTDFSSTRLRSYEELLAWSRRAGVDKRAQVRFRSERDHHRILASRGLRGALGACFTLLVNTSLWKRPDSVNAAVSAVVGRNNRLTRALHILVSKVFDLLWRVRGGNRPGSIRTVDAAAQGTWVGREPD